jgi:phosphatidylglycerol:prolipoprotein diacylglycerol transferase
MRIVLFSVFGFNVYSHGVFLMLAMVIGGVLLFRLASKESMKVNNFLSNYIVSILTGIIVSRVLYYLMNLSSYQNIYQIAEVWQGGLVSFAGFIAGGLTFLILVRAQKQTISSWLDLAGIAFPLAIAIGRIGCVLAGEVGKRSHSQLAFYGYVPVTAMEIYLGILIFIINFSFYLFFRKYLTKYLLFFNFVALYSFARVFIDAYRADKSLIIGVNLSQITSLVILLIAIFAFGLYYYQRKWRQNVT